MAPNKKKNNKEESKEEQEPEAAEAPEEEVEAVPVMFDLGALAGSKEPKIRVTGIYGDINEEKCSETLYGLLMLKETMYSTSTVEDEKTGELVDVETIRPIDFYLSTHGGSATDMFAVYDTMRQIREECPIRTFGMGKVMSAGVLLLAAGTKGERRIGANCRVMIHGVISGQQGYLADVENEFEEAKFTQELYIKALAKETDMTIKYLRKLLQRKTNVYLSAKDAVELGIADIIV